MIDIFLTILVAGTGGDDCQTRKAAEFCLQAVVDWTEETGPVEAGVRGRDAEVRARCKRVLARHRRVGVPPGLSLSYFEKKTAPGLWKAANKLPASYDQDTREYVRLLMARGGMKPSQVRALIERTDRQRGRPDPGYWRDFPGVLPRRP